MNDLKPTLPMNCHPLPCSFFERDTLAVARELLGCQLWKLDSTSNHWIQCTIVETEAYTGDDPACHAYNRKTGRAQMLYQAPGTAYVYLIYGMYDCLNVVTEPEGTAGAVLFRALAPSEGLDLKTNGPGRLTRALNITRQQFNGLPLTKMDSGLFLASGPSIPEERIIQTTRIGITKATEALWRFYIADSPWVSVKQKIQQKTGR